MTGFIRNIGVIALMAVAQSCGSRGTGNAGRTDSDSIVVAEDFHADNDIAMTVRSVVDAIRVAEPMDTTDYNFDGVLTDGQGHAIYSNMHGLPGRWDVDVLSRSCVSIRNVDLGDLMTDDLENYILSSLNLDASALVDSLSRKVDNGSDRKVYDFDGGLLQFEVHTSTAPNGIEAPLVVITATAYP